MHRRGGNTVKSTLNDKMGELLGLVKASGPLICHVTNSVVTNWTANVTLAMGASPVMTESVGDGLELVDMASALVLNMGTADGSQVDLLLELGRRADQRGIPIVLDPVGSGATRYRTTVAKTLLETTNPTVVRANAGEAASLAGTEGLVRGVDSAASQGPDPDFVRNLASDLGRTLAVTGKTDLVSDGNAVFLVEAGHELLTAVTGTGCAATTVVACFAAVAPEEPALAATAALAWYGMAAKRAAVGAEGPGSFSWRLLDEIWKLAPEAAKELSVTQAA